MNPTEPANTGAAFPSWTWADVLWLLAIGLVGLVLRIGSAVQYAAHPIGQWPWVDEGAYWTRAIEIGSGRWLPDLPFYQDPLFPYALSALIRIVGPEIATLRVALAGLGALTPLFVFLAGRWGLGRAEGVLAGLATAVYGPLIFTDGLLEKEGLAALLAAIALTISARCLNAGPRWRMAGIAAAGWTWGLVALLRANALIVAPIGFVWAASLGLSRRSRALLSTSFVAGFGLAIAPAVVVNAIVAKPPELIVTTWQGGANFYIGNGTGATGTYWAPDFVEATPAREALDFKAEASRRSGRGLTPGEVSRYWFGQGITRWREAPVASVALLAKKIGLLLNDFEVPDNQDRDFVRIVAAPRLAWGFVGFGGLFPFAVLGLVRRDRTRFWQILAASTVVGLASTAVFFVVGRYRIPWLPGLALLGAVGAVDLHALARSRRWKSLAWRLTLVAAPAVVLAGRPLDDPVPDRWGHAEIALAVAELGASHLEPAIDALDDARAFGPEAAFRVDQIVSEGPVHDRLATLVGSRLEDNRGRPDLLRSTLARWLRQVPEGQAEARRLLDQALALDPTDRVALRERGALRLAEVEEPEARKEAAKELALAARPPNGDPSAAILGAILARDGDLLPDLDNERFRLLSPRLPLARAVLGRR